MNGTHTHTHTHRGRKEGNLSLVNGIKFDNLSFVGSGGNTIAYFIIS